MSSMDSTSKKVYLEMALKMNKEGLNQLFSSLKKVETEVNKFKSISEAVSKTKFANINKDLRQLGTQVTDVKSILGKTYTSIDQAANRAATKLNEEIRQNKVLATETRARMKEEGAAASMIQRISKKRLAEEEKAYSAIYKANEKARISKIKEIEKVDKLLAQVEKRKLAKEMGPTPFAGWAMSIMFAGMAMQRFATQLKQFGTKAYDDIRHSVEGSVTANDKLNASMTMLGFSVGEALQPLLETLIPIVDSISEWVEKNPELVKDITQLMFILGTAAAAGGALILAKNGFGDMLSLMKGFPTSFKDIKNLDWAGLGTTIQTSIGAIVIGIGVADTISGMKELFDGDGKDGLKAGLKTMAGVLETVGGLKFIKGAKGGTWMIAVGIALDSVSRGTFITDFINLFGWVSAMIATLVQSIIHGIKEMWKSAMDKDHEYVNFDANKKYKENLKNVQLLGKAWQADMNNFMYGDELPAEFRNYSLPSEGANAISQQRKQAVTIAIYGDIYTSGSSDLLKQTKKQGIMWG